MARPRSPTDLLWLAATDAMVTYIGSLCDLLARSAPRHEPEVEAARQRKAAAPSA